MSDFENSIATAISRRPWNKGKLTGAKPPLRPNMSGRFGRSFRSRVAFATLPCLIWRLTASFAAVTSSRSRSRMSLPEDTRRIVQRYDRRRPDIRSDLN